jgi:pimeloyl-ACP methyl ester carboxylesterase
VIALQLALDAPEVVHSLILLEPALLDVPGRALLAEALEPSVQSYQAGTKEEAADGFLQVVIGRDYRTWLKGAIPGGYEQAVGDADTFLGQELPALGEWRFTREDARRARPAGRCPPSPRRCVSASTSAPAATRPTGT